MQFLKKSLPTLISLALIGWLIWKVEPEKLSDAFAKLNWTALIPITLGLVLALYFWESLCFRVVFSLPESPLTYRQMLRVRGVSYLLGVVNYEAGQAMAAWRVSKLQETSVASALSRALLLGYHDLVVLFGLGTLGASLAADPLTSGRFGFCLTGFLILLSLSLLPVLLPRNSREKLKQTRWGAWMDSWNWQRSGMLVLVRVVYFSFFIIYASIALGISGIAIDHTVALGTIPLVLLFDALPSASGLGVRDVAMQELLSPGAFSATLAAVSLVWSSGLLFGRFGIGVFHLWLPEQKSSPEAPTK